MFELQIPSTETAIRDGDGYDLPQRECGGLRIREPQMMSTYDGQAEETAKNFRSDDFLYAGDLAAMNDEAYLRIMCRIKRRLSVFTMYKNTFRHKFKLARLHLLIAALFASSASTYAPAQVTIPSSTSTVNLEILAPGQAVFDLPLGATITAPSGDGIGGNNSQNWQLSIHGSVTGASSGVRLSSATANGAQVDNFGFIRGDGTGSAGASAGVNFFGNGGKLINHAGATISSASDGVFSNTAGVNITNQSGGTISGNIGVNLTAGSSTLTNQGTITGTGGTAINMTSAGNSLILDTGSILNGSATSTGANNVLTLQGSGSEDSNLTGFSALNMNGSNWTLSGVVSTTGTTAAATNIQSGTLIITGTLNNDGAGGGMTVAPGARLQLGNGGTTGTTHSKVINNGELVAFRSDTSISINADVSGSGIIRFLGTGVAGQSSYRVDADHSTFTGDMIIGNGARVQSVSANPTPLAHGILVEDGGTLWLGSTSNYTSHIYVQGNGWTESGGGQLGALRLDSDAAVSGQVTLRGNTRMTAVFSTYEGSISGAIDDGGHGYALEKAGDGLITLSGVSSYSGGTNISAGTLMVTNGNALGSGAVNNHSKLELNFASDSTLANALSGTGSLIKSGAGIATLTGAGSSMGNVSVSSGTLHLAQSGAFSVVNGDYTTVSGAATTIDANSTLNVSGIFTQAAGSTLNLALGSTQPVITANTASLNGALNITGFGATAPTTASALTSTQFNLIHTNAPGGIAGDFSPVNIPGTTSPDYLILSGHKSANNQDYNVGFGLTWLAGPALGNGIFTLANASDAFNVDVVLANQTGPFVSGWNGQTLTKAGVGTLTLSAANTYTGGTLLNGGVLSIANNNNLGAAAGGLTFNGGTLQTTSNIASARTVLLNAGGGTIDTAGRTDTFSGVISGAGDLRVTGGGRMIMTASNSYTGLTTIDNGSVLQLGSSGSNITQLAGNILNNGEFALSTAPNGATNPDYAGVISGSGSVRAMSGTLRTVLTGSNTYTGDTIVASGASLIIGRGTTGSINSASNIITNGTIDFGRSDTVTIANNISGTGGVVVDGGGTTILTGNTTYTGEAARLLAGSTLQISSASGSVQYLINQGSTLRTTADMTISNAAIVFATTGTNTLEVQAGTSLTVTNRISNSNATTGTSRKTGGGTLILSNPAANSSVANFTVDAGTLQLAQPGQLFTANSYTTASGATTQIDANSTMKVTNAFTQAAGSTLSFTLGSTQPIISAGTASLNGALNINGFSTSLPNTASAITGTQFNLIHTNAPGGITGDFSPVNIPGASSPDYLILSDGKSANAQDYNVGFGLTWLAGSALGNGTFTLANASDTFNVDVALANQTGPFTSGWDGQSLTKAGAGTLILSAANTYTGDTLVNGGTLNLGIANSIASSANVNVGANGTITVGANNQILNNLTGSGHLDLGSAVVDANNASNTIFNGLISGEGSLSKTGNGSLTLSGNNTYSGGTTISTGILIASNGKALGSGTVNNNGLLELNFASDSTLNNVLSGSGTLNKTGAGIATLTATGSHAGHVVINTGTLALAQNGTFSSSGDIYTDSGATLSLAADSLLATSGQFIMSGTLSDTAGSIDPAITASTATINTGTTFNLSGYSAPASASVSQLANNVYTEIHTTGGLSGTFSNVNLGGSSSPVDYLTLTSFYTAQDYDIGLALTWYAAHATNPQAAHGTFTLVNASEYFDMDAVLADETANAATSWDGKTLTKAGAGTLRLSKQNTYTGTTIINGGTLQAGIANAFASSNAVTIASGATLDLNNFNQIANNVSGAGSITLGGATLSANSSSDTTFSGLISGTGALDKTGNATLILSGDNTYSGGTTITAGTLQLGDGGSTGSVIGNIANSGTLAFNRSDNVQFNDTISGSGNLIQQGSGHLILAQSQTYTGTTAVNAGALILSNDAQLATSDANIASGATLGGYGGVAGNVINNGLLAVADAAPGFANGPAGHFTIGGNLTNSGEIRMASPIPASTLTINGNYTGNNGLLTLSTVLGDDNSATDKLIVRGDTAGTTRVVINNSGGAGAATTNGIRIVEVGGQSNGQFTLANRVVAGPYEYNLYQGLPNQADGNWYLRSLSLTPATPQWRPEAGAYLGNQSLAGVMQMHTLYDRQGGQYTSGNGNSWVRLVGGRIDSQAADGQIGIDSDYTLVQFGGDLLARSDGKQQLQIGLLGSWGSGDTDSIGNRDLNGNRHTASGSLNGFSLGAYATWFADVQTRQGAYVDSWLQYGWYDNDVKGQGLPSDSYDSRLFTASLESGYSIPLNSDDSPTAWRLIPQAQIAYSRYSADRFTDSSGTKVSGQDRDLLTTRLGVRLAGKIQRNGTPLEPFAELNWWHGSEDLSVKFDGRRVEEGIPKDRAELKFGLQGEFNKRWSGWVNVRMQDNFDDYRRIEGMAGVRYVW